MTAAVGTAQSTFSLWYSCRETQKRIGNQGHTEEKNKHGKGAAAALSAVLCGLRGHEREERRDGCFLSLNLYGIRLCSSTFMG